MGDNSKKPSRIFSVDREVPHVRLGDESSMDAKFDWKEILGQGSFGIVHRALSLESNEEVAIKIINRDKAGSANIKLIEREIGILKTVSHDNIIKLVKVYETTNKIYLVFELCDMGELSKILEKFKAMNESTVKNVVEKLAAAIAYLHLQGIVHRDLKLENILVATNPSDQSDQYFIKVTDFGLSVVRGGMGPESMLSSFCGTPAYMAPEIIQNKSYSESCDNWAIGCITFALLTGQLPFQSKDDEKLYDAIKSVDPDWNSLPRNLSNDAKECLQKLLSKDPASRMTAGELLRHPWITGKAGSATPNVLDLMHEFHIEEEGKKIKEDTSNGSGQPSSADQISKPHPTSKEFVKRSPSDHDVNKVPSKSELAKGNVFETSLPASSNTRHFFQSSSIKSNPKSNSNNNIVNRQRHSSPPRSSPKSGNPNVRSKKSFFS